MFIVEIVLRVVVSIFFEVDMSIDRRETKKFGINCLKYQENVIHRNAEEFSKKMEVRDKNTRKIYYNKLNTHQVMHLLTFLLLELL